jgi:hypothetical protein
MVAAILKTLDGVGFRHRGAVEIWMPAMPQLLALEIERARAMFAHARDGHVPAGQTAPEISLLDRVDIRKGCNAWLQSSRKPRPPGGCLGHSAARSPVRRTEDAIVSAQACLL